MQSYTRHRRKEKALDNLPNKILAVEYRIVLSDEQLIAQELEGSQVELEERQVKLRLNK